ncbi:MAG TPA: hypothetical protein VFP97_03135 [Chitinophagaceae bacterium]|nr:hypothetical protein [Chitinophagaceae bacterium]
MIKIRIYLLHFVVLYKKIVFSFRLWVTFLRSGFTQSKIVGMGERLASFLLIIFAFVLIVSCGKNPVDNQSSALNYGNSVFYISAQEYFIYPTKTQPGTYSAFPDEGIDLDENSGAIKIKGDDNNIYTGLKYKIIHTAPDGDTSSTTIMISGIQFLDQFYRLSQNDTIAVPIYNGDPANSLPLTGSSFDDGGTANSGGCSVKTTNGQINLAQTVRNGIFGANPQNDARREFDIEYRLNDQSGNAKNKIRVKLYYYNTMAEVAPDLLQTLNERQQQGIFLGMNNTNFENGSTFRTATVSALAKPRPPCVIIIGQ